MKEVKEISPEDLEKLVEETAGDSKIFREFNLEIKLRKGRKSLIFENSEKVV